MLDCLHSVLILISLAICTITDFKEIIDGTYKDAVNDLPEDDYWNAKDKDEEMLKCVIKSIEQHMKKSHLIITKARVKFK